MAKELQVEFHNPNSEVVMASFLVELFFEANMEKVEKIIKSSLRSESVENALAEEREYFV